jgi:hypothetical protein
MDISKHSFDVAVFSVDNPENIYHKSFTNDRYGFNELVVFFFLPASPHEKVFCPCLPHVGQ